MTDYEGSAITEVTYENVNDEGCFNLRTEENQPPQYTGSFSVKNRKPRAAEVCLCLLCVLLLTAVIVICVFYINERKNLLTHIHNLTEEREQTLKHVNNLTEEREETLKHVNNLTEERELILKHVNNLTEEREQILKDKNKLYHWLNEQDRLSDNFKWIYYSFSFYYISSEKKSWSDSRQYCQQRGADLAIVKGQKETEFLWKFVQNNSFWIGWRETDKVWKWIDDPTVANGFGTDSSNCAGLSTENTYTYSCDSALGWICKKTYN